MKAQDLNFVGGRECVAEVLHVRQMLWGLSPASSAELIKELTEANKMLVLVERSEESSERPKAIETTNEFNSDGEWEFYTD